MVSNIATSFLFRSSPHRFRDLGRPSPSYSSSGIGCLLDVRNPQFRWACRSLHEGYEVDHRSSRASQVRHQAGFRDRRGCSSATGTLHRRHQPPAGTISESPVQKLPVYQTTSTTLPLSRSPAEMQLRPQFRTKLKQLNPRKRGTRSSRSSSTRRLQRNEDAYRPTTPRSLLWSLLWEE